MTGREDVSGVHRRLHRRRQVRRRLPRRGGAATPAGRRPGLPAADVGPRPDERIAVQRPHRAGRRPQRARGPGAGQPLRGPAGRSAALVPLPPPLRGRAAREAAGRAARPRARSSTRAAATWHEQAGDVAEAIRHSLLGAGLRACRASSSRRSCRRSAATAARRRCGAGSRPCRRRSCGPPGAGQRPGRAPGCPPASSTGSRSCWTRRRSGSRSGGAPAAASSRGAAWTDEEYRRLPADLAVHRAGLALVRGDIEQTVAHARAALDQVGDGRPR